MISPGVADLVAELNAAGYRTTDSGDGTNFAEGMECALPFRHVFGVFDFEDTDMRIFADELQARYPTAKVEVSYSPATGSVWMLFPDGEPGER